MIPSFEDIVMLAQDNSIVHACFSLYRRGEIAGDEFLLLCISSLVEELDRTRDALYSLSLRTPPSPTLLTISKERVAKMERAIKDALEKGK